MFEGNDLRDANSAKSTLQEFIPLAKTHKLPFLSDTIHGNGTPINSLQTSSSGTPINEQIQFRFIMPLKNASSSNLGRVLGKKLESIQNSGFRTNSIEKIAKEVQTSIRENPVQENEGFVSLDCVKFYDNLHPKLVKYCVEKLWTRFKTAEPKDKMKLKDVCSAIDLIAEEGVLFNNKIYSLRVLLDRQRTMNILLVSHN